MVACHPPTHPPCWRLLIPRHDASQCRRTLPHISTTVMYWDNCRAMHSKTSRTHASLLRYKNTPAPTLPYLGTTKNASRIFPRKGKRILAPRGIHIHKKIEQSCDGTPSLLNNSLHTQIRCCCRRCCILNKVRCATASIDHLLMLW